MGWISSLLLESPVPPPSWLATGSERRAQARSVVHRLLERRAAHRPWHPGHFLHDLGSAYPMFGAGRYVTGDEIESTLEDELTHLNPPVLQGWAVAFMVATTIAFFLLLRAASGPQHADSLPFAISAFVASIGFWAALEILVGWREHELELCQHGVAVRRWTDVWFRRAGRVLDDPALLEATSASDELRLIGPNGAVGVDLRIWPPSAREALHDELEAWGIAFGHRHEEHRRGTRRHARP